MSSQPIPGAHDRQVAELTLAFSHPRRYDAGRASGIAAGPLVNLARIETLRVGEAKERWVERFRNLALENPRRRRAMPWELTIKSDQADPSLRSNDWPFLGSGDEVCRRITESLPTSQWRHEPSFIEQHQHLPEDHPIRRFINASTPEQRESNARPKYKGLYEGDDFVIEFHVQDGPIRFFLIDVRGGSNPLPSLARLCKANQWAIEDVTGKAVDLDLPSAPGWEEFTRWRDRAIKPDQGERG